MTKRKGQVKRRMVNMDPLISALKKVGITVESQRMDRIKNPDGTYEEVPFVNPKMYPFGFEVFIYTDTTKQLKAITRAIEVSWFAFKNRVPCVYRELVRMEGKTRRGIISAAWPRSKEEDLDSVGELFIDVLAKEIQEPGSSEILLEALENADQIIDEMLGKMEEDRAVDEEEVLLDECGSSNNSVVDGDSSVDSMDCNISA